MNYILSQLRCKACDEDLSDFEVRLDDFEGFCQPCFESSMEAAYQDQWWISQIEKDFFKDGS